MSLTSTIQAHPEVRHLVPHLKSILTDLDGSPMSPASWKTPIAVPSVGKAHEAGIVGTAFDYAARAVLTRQVGTKNVDARRPVAEEGLAVLPKYLRIADRSLQLEKDAAIRAERLQGFELARAHEADLTRYLAERLQEALAALEGFVEGTRSLDEYVQHTVLLARLDAVFRSGSVVVIDEFLQSRWGRSYFSQKASVSDSELVTNVSHLADTFRHNFADVPLSHVSLNPVFGPYSNQVGGADADLIIDSTLLDIKSTTKLGYNAKDWAQVLGYLAMGRAVGMPIDRAGIYFARYGLCALVAVSADLSEFLPGYLEAILFAAASDDPAGR